MVSEGWLRIVSLWRLFAEVVVHPSGLNAYESTLRMKGLLGMLRCCAAVHACMCSIVAWPSCECQRVHGP